MANPGEAHPWTQPDRAPLFGVRREHLDYLGGEGVLARLPASRQDGDDGQGSRSVDVARSLEVDMLHAGALGWQHVSESAWGSLAYLDEALLDDGRRARAWRGGDGHWQSDADDSDAEDALGQVMLALGEACARGSDRNFLSASAALFRRSMPAAERLTRLRPIASVILGCEAARRSGLEEAAGLERTLVATLAARFEPVAWSLDWPWPDAVLSSQSAVPARALIVAGRRISDRRMVEMGLAVLDWLVKSAVAPRGHLSPVGDNGWWVRHGVRAAFDQLPTEPLSLLLAAETAYRATGNTRHLADMERAYGWFLGANDVGMEVADPDRGGCRDGLGPNGPRLNQGAEATLAWLTALEHIRVSRRHWAAAA
jgi:hypothetical protein